MYYFLILFFTHSLVAHEIHLSNIIESLKCNNVVLFKDASYTPSGIEISKFTERKSIIIFDFDKFLDVSKEALINICPLTNSNKETCVDIILLFHHQDDMTSNLYEIYASWIMNNVGFMQVRNVFIFGNKRIAEWMQQRSHYGQFYFASQLNHPIQKLISGEGKNSCGESMKNCFMRLEIPNYSSSSFSKEHLGYGIKLFKAMSQKFNISYEWSLNAERKWGNMLPNGSFYGAVGSIFKREADFSWSGFLYTTGRGKGIGILSPMTANAHFLVSKMPSTKAIASQSFLEIFGKAIWCLLALSVILAVVFLTIWKGITNLKFTRFDLIRGFLFQPIPKWKTLEMNSSSMFIIAWTLSSYAIGLMYFCTFMSIVIIPQLEDPIDDLNDVKDRNMKIFIEESTAQAWMLQTYFPNYKNLIEFHREADHWSFEKQDTGVYVSIPSKLSMLYWRLLLVQYSLLQYMDSSLNPFLGECPESPKVYVSNKPVFGTIPVFSSWITVKYAPWTEKLNNFIARVVETYLTKMEIRIAQNFLFQRKECFKGNRYLFRLSLSHTAFAFYCLFFGLMIATLIFFIEVSCKSSSSFKN